MGHDIKKTSPRAVAVAVLAASSGITAAHAARTPQVRDSLIKGYVEVPKFTGNAPSPLLRGLKASSDLASAQAQDVCETIFVPGAHLTDSKNVTSAFMAQCVALLKNSAEAMGYLQREADFKNTWKVPYNQTQITILDPSQSALTVPATQNNPAGDSGITASTRNAVTPFWPRSQGPVSAGVAGGEAALKTKSSFATAPTPSLQAVVNGLLGAKLAHWNFLHEDYDKQNDPDFIKNNKQLASGIAPDQHDTSLGQALGTWLKTIAKVSAKKAGLDAFPANKHYASEGPFPKGTGELFGDVFNAITRAPGAIDFDGFIGTLPARMQKAGLSAKDQKAIMSSWSNIMGAASAIITDHYQAPKAVAAAPAPAPHKQSATRLLAGSLAASAGAALVTSFLLV